jgi:lipoprotein
MIKKTIIIILSVILCIACSAIMVACNNEETPNGDISHIEKPDTDNPATDEPGLFKHPPQCHFEKYLI